MTDWHVHIGQWFDTYYNAENVFAELKAVGIDEVWFSSTTSCRYCKESFAVQNDAAMQETLPTAHELYELIRYEVQEALTTADRLGIKAHALYWVVPELHFSGATDVADAMEELPYEGFKIHPRGNPWHLEDKKTAELAEEVFAYAENNNKLVLVHCGEGIFELPTVFEPYIAVHSGCTVQLAHCRPLKETLYMLGKYPNTVCDTAFTPSEVQNAVRSAGFAERMRYGTDYPVSKLWEQK